MAKDVELFRNEFALEKPTHIPLNNAGMCLVPKVTIKKMEELNRLYAEEGAYGVAEVFGDWEKARAALAQLVGAESAQVAWTPNCSAGLSFVANGYEATEGEEIVIFENDYPANFYPWVARARQHKSQLKVVKVESDLCRSMDKIRAAITPKTKIVAVSHVQSDSGYLMDISEISEAAHKVGALVVVDVIQSAGICPLDFKKSGADVFSGGTHKWLCAPAGAGYLVLQEQAMKKITPSLHGALNYGTFEEAPSVDKQVFANAKKFEQGTPSFYGILGALSSIEVLQQFSVDNLWKKAQSLRAKLKNSLTELGCSIYGGATTGPQLSFSHSRKNVRDISQALNAERISHALRPAPVAEGRVLRISPQAYNTDQEISHTIDVIKKAIG